MALSVLLASSTVVAADSDHVSQTGVGVQESDVKVCSVLGPAVASCHARLRTDAKVRGKQPQRARTQHTATPDLIGNSGAYDPSYLQSAYNLTSAATNSGRGHTVAVVDAYDSPSAEQDLATYRSLFGLSPCSTASGCFRKVNQTGAAGPYPPAHPGWAQESSLDIDMVSAICPNCRILLVEANSARFDDLGQAVNTAASMGADVISNSYGASEFSSEESSYGAFYNHPGIPVVVSSGDSGYGVQFPAASPYVTAVGGTTLNQVSNTGFRNATETAWSGGGSGCSVYENKPEWQTDSGCSRRSEADVSAVADPQTGVWVYDSFAYNAQSGWLVFGGTSVSAPIVAAIYALTVDPRTATYGSTPYANLKASQDPTNRPLFDIVSGRNGSCGGSYLCTSVAGYDGPTGLGTANGVGAFSASAVSAAPSFSISASPPARTAVRADANAVYSVSLNALNGYASSVQLSVTGLPARTTALFSPNPLIPDETSTLSVHANRSASRGTYQLTITASGSDGTNHATAVSLTIA